MPARRRLALILWLVLGAVFLAAAPLPAQDAVPAAADERAARLAERYKAMLAANPVEGIALDRLWKFYDDKNATGRLLDEYRDASTHPPTGQTAMAPTLIHGYLLKKAGKLDEAAAEFRRAAALDAASSLPLLAAAALAQERGKPADAAALYEQTLAKIPDADPRRSDLLFKLGTAWLAAGEPLKAAEAWESMVALDPGNFTLRRELAASYEKNNLPDRAITHHEYIEKHGSPADRAQALRDLGRLYEARNAFDPARDAYERGLALTSRDNWLHAVMESELIRLHQRAGRVAELETRWRAGAAENPRDLGAWLRLEHLAEAQADPAGQRSALQKIIALAPRDRDSTLKLARLLTDAGEREQAAALYDALLKVQPENVELILARADLDLQLNRPAAAVERIEARIARAPADESVTSPALEFFLSHHLDEAAERRLRADAARQPGADDPQLALAKFLYAQHKPAQSRAILEDLAARPGDPAIRAARLVRIAEIHKEQNRPVDALHSWGLAAELAPRLPAPLVAMGDFRLAHGDVAEAAEAFERAVEVTPEGPDRTEVDRKLFQALQTIDPGTGNPAAGASERGASGIPASLRRILSPLGMARPLPGTPGAEPPTSAASPDGTPLARYLAKLQADAGTHPTAVALVRLARWSQWTHDLPAALAAAEDAARLDPRDLPSREMLAALAVEGRQHEVAERWLREIIAIDPSRRAVCLRQIANGKLEDGDFDGALAIFDDLQRTETGSISVLSDLAVAQQRADHWSDALATWERAYALPGATPAQRAEIRRPLLAGLERMEQFPRAAEILQSAIDDARDLDTRQDLFKQLSVFCRQHGLRDKLRNDYENRLKAQPQDYFLLTALAELRKDAGHEREAYHLLGQAFYSAPDPARSLRGLVEAAEALGAIDEAGNYQRRLSALPGQGTLENLEKLASLEDTGTHADAAARTWEMVATRFPRDPAALGHAEAFFEAAGSPARARELLDQVVRINAADNRQIFHLGELDAANGDPAGARTAFEQLLARTEPEKPGGPLVLPADLDQSPPLETGSPEMAIYRHAIRISAPPTPATPENGDLRLRLKAIRETSLLLFPAARGGKMSPAGPPAAVEESARQQWLAHWQEAEKAGARSEPLWAFFYANQKPLVMDCLTRWLEKEPANLALHKAFLGLGVRLDEYPRVAAWAWSPNADAGGPATRGRELVQILSQWLVGADVEASGNLIKDLFPPEVKARDILWLAATNVFAARGRYAEAVELGGRIFDNAPPDFRAGYGLELAHWNLWLGREEPARETLHRVIEKSESDTLDANTGGAVFAALREYYLLLPTEQQRRFVESFLAQLRTRAAAAPHVALAGVLLHGLSGDEPAAQRDLDTLLGMRLLTGEDGTSSPDARRLGYLLACGLQLESWNLAPLAVYLWRHAVNESTGFDRQQADSQLIFAELRNQLLYADIAMASGPQTARERVDDFLRTRPSATSAAALGTALAAASRPADAARVQEYLCALEPDVAEHWQERFTALRSAGDLNGAEQLWRGLLDPDAHWPTALSRPETVRQLASLLENEMSDGESARQLLWRERGAEKGAPAAMMLTQLASSYERAGQPENAVRAWLTAADSDPTGSGALLSAAAIEAKKLNLAARALARLQPLAYGNLPPVEHDRVSAATVGVLLALKQSDEAAELSFDLLHNNQPEIVAGAAANLASAGQGAVARQLLTASVHRMHDPQARLRQQQALVEMIGGTGGGAGDDAALQRELRRLRAFADDSGPLRAVFDDARYDLARKRHLDAWLEGELTRDWREGAGRRAAGEDLARLYLETRRDPLLSKTVAQLLARPVNGSTVLPKMVTQLLDSGYTALAVSVAQALCRANPQNESFALVCAKALWKDNRQDEARRWLASLAATEALRDNICAQIGGFCLEIGDTALARTYLERAAAADPLGLRTPQPFLQLAGLDLDVRDWPAARRNLRAAYRSPACDDLGPLVRYLCATVPPGPDRAARLNGRDFSLSFAQRARLLPALAEALEKSGRAEGARGLVAAHPELLAAIPGYIRTLRENLPPGDGDALSKLTMLVDGVAAQTDPPCLELNRQLAALHTLCAERELTGASAYPPTVESAIEHLARAHGLAPTYFPTARRLAQLQMDRKQPGPAAETLRDFLTADALPEEHAEAAGILHKS